MNSKCKLLPVLCFPHEQAQQTMFSTSCLPVSDF